jgi:DNA-binding transcriptional LysR family regulator
MRINYDLEDIRAFCCVARMGQYTSAAALLCVTTSALSRRIAKLESEIGGRLFERTTRSVVLTSVGRARYERVLPIVTQMDASLTEAARRARGHEGTLMVSTVASVGYSVLPKVLPEFYARHPQVYLSIRDGNATVTTGLVEEREVEFGITTPVSFGPTLEAERVATYGFNLVYAEGSALAPRSRKLSWKKLPGLPVVGLNPVSSTRLQIDSVLNARGLELPWTIEVDQLATMIGLVQSGNFVTIMPALFEAHGYGLKSIPVLDPDITRDVYIVRRRDSTPTPQGQYLMELVRAYLAR